MHPSRHWLVILPGLESIWWYHAPRPSSPSYLLSPRVTFLEHHIYTRLNPGVWPSRWLTPTVTFTQHNTPNIGFKESSDQLNEHKDSPNSLFYIILSNEWLLGDFNMICWNCILTQLCRAWRLCSSSLRTDSDVWGFNYFWWARLDVKSFPTEMCLFSAWCRATGDAPLVGCTTTTWTWGRTTTGTWWTTWAAPRTGGPGERPPGPCLTARGSQGDTVDLTGWERGDCRGSVDMSDMNLIKDRSMRAKTEAFEREAMREAIRATSEIRRDLTPARSEEERQASRYIDEAQRRADQVIHRHRWNLSLFCQSEFIRSITFLTKFFP